MTLSTRAEHEQARETSYVEDEVATHVSPDAAAEDAVIDLEGSETDPTVVDDPHVVAREVAGEVAEDAEEWAGCYTDSCVVAELVGHDYGNQAYDAVLAGLKGSPCIEVEA